MCARYYRLKDLKDLFQRFGLKRVLTQLGLQFNIAPTEEALAIPATDGERVGKPMKFGVENPWVEGAMLVNMKGENFALKPAFKKYLLNQRCLIPADGFFEWRKTKEGSWPFRFSLQSGEPFGLAAIYMGDRFAIITTEPNALVAEVNDRMPVIIRREDEDTWLDANVKDFAKLIVMLAPYPADQMKCVPLSKLVNSAKNKMPEILNPLQ